MITNYDKIIICFRLQKVDNQKYLVYGLSTDLIKQGDYVNVVVLNECDRTIETVLCGFIRRIYFGSLVNSEIAMAFPTEEHTFLILIDNFYSTRNKLALENKKILTEAKSKSGFNILINFISQSKNILTQKNKSFSVKMNEIRKIAEKSVKQLRSLNIPSTLKNKIIDKIKKLISYFMNKGQKKGRKNIFD